MDANEMSKRYFSVRKTWFYAHYTTFSAATRLRGTFCGAKRCLRIFPGQYYILPYLGYDGQHTQEKTPVELVQRMLDTA